jgi:dimeric dUTPase (all-alpha-NTP-PPase superfamily)
MTNGSKEIQYINPTTKIGKHTKVDVIVVSGLLDGQRLLMKEAYNNKGRSDAKDIALFVEAGEMINELGHIWKYWKKNHNTNWDNIKEELADVLHFILEKGVELDVEPLHRHIVKFTDPIEHINEFVRAIPTTGDGYFNWWTTMATFRGLVDHLGIEWDDMVSAYWDKNMINRQRQERGY